MTDNYYEELGVDPSASRDEIRDAHQARVADLEAQREKKGVTESQLQQNREAVARVRKAWNVLSDPYQRGRYDQKMAAPAPGEVEVVDDDGSASPSSEVQLTGWRKFMAPPPPKDAGAPRGRNEATGRREKAEPTLVLPEGRRIAEPRNRGMALLFDLSVLIVIFFGLNLLLPSLIQSDYKDIQDQITKVNDLHSAQSDIDDAKSSLKDAKTASDRASANKDLNTARQDFSKAQKAAEKAGITSTPHDAKALQKQADKLTDKIKTTGYIVSGVMLVLALAYLVPITAITGHTFGMSRRRLEVIRVNGAPVGWYASFVRFLVPVLFAVAIPAYGALLGLGIVAWGYFDRNGQGIHDKLARTVVVDA
jgi:curved DNA-binding protein CbpA